MTTEIFYGDAVSSDAKLTVVKNAAWAGVGFWQASGMWPADTDFFSAYDNTTQVSTYCKEDILAQWTVVTKHLKRPSV